ncbi:MAG: hypothetical protein ACD_73C00077G0001 [uncultured bacterium]|nr:MAG: hypothetical protein ACD_73C00077G0001 [uncultured bacterium]
MWQSIHSLIENRFYVDEFYLFVTRKIIFARIAAPIAWFDRHVVDGFMNLCGRFTRVSGNKIGIAQTGQTQTYLAWMVLGLILAIIFKW